MDHRELIVVNEFPKDMVFIRVPATYLKLNHYRYYKKSTSEEFGRNEVDDFRGSGEMFLTNYHFIFFTDRTYRYIHPRTQRPVLFEKPYMIFHRGCLGCVDFENNIIRIDEIIYNSNDIRNNYGKYTFSIHHNFQNFAHLLGLYNDPSYPFLEFDVVPKFQSYYKTVYPQERDAPDSCPRCGFRLQFHRENRKYFCLKCGVYL